MRYVCGNPLCIHNDQEHGFETRHDRNYHEAFCCHYTSHDVDDDSGSGGGGDDAPHQVHPPPSTPPVSPPPAAAAAAAAAEEPVDGIIAGLGLPVDGKKAIRDLFRMYDAAFLRPSKAAAESSDGGCVGDGWGEGRRGERRQGGGGRRDEQGDKESGD